MVFARLQLVYEGGRKQREAPWMWTGKAPPWWTLGLGSSASFSAGSKSIPHVWRPDHIDGSCSCWRPGPGSYQSSSSVGYRALDRAGIVGPVMVAGAGPPFTPGDRRCGVWRRRRLKCWLIIAIEDCAIVKHHGSLGHVDVSSSTPGLVNLTSRTIDYTAQRLTRIPDTPSALRPGWACA